MSSHSPLTSIGAWTFSLALHGLSLGAALVLAAEFSVIPREHPFRWEVSLISAPVEQPFASEVPSQAPTSSAPASSFTSNAAAQRVTTAKQTARIGSASVAKRGVALDQGTLAPSPDRRRSSEPISTNMATPDPVMTPLEQPQPGRGSDASPLPLSTDWPVTTATIGELPPPIIEAVDTSNLAMDPAVPETPRLVNRPSPQFRDAAVSRSVLADYGWLAKMLFEEVEQAKRYPPIAKRHRWQGSVVLQARIHEDGRVSDITVIQQSEHPPLDLDAIALLEGTSPISLKYPLGQPSVVVQIPIGYRLE
ncbi:MAG: TonB family protein [Nitrospira sp.]|nr:TonB family protein [Nitrospira sp.]